jgi:hypothetical protein
MTQDGWHEMKSRLRVNSCTGGASRWWSYNVTKKMTNNRREEFTSVYVSNDIATRMSSASLLSYKQAFSSI